MPPRRRSPGVKAPAEPDALYRVFRTADGQPAHLPTEGSRGLTLDEAERISRSLLVDTEVREVWRREEES